MATQSPFLSLPNELIVEIAVVTQNGDEENTKSELILSNVCRRFRHAVLGAPELWTKVEMDLTSEGSTNLSQLYLDRSTAREIWVTLRALLAGDVLETKGLRQLTPHLARISRLSVEADDSRNLDKLLVPFRNVAVPRLQHFEVVNQPYAGFRDPYQLPNDLFSLGAPRVYSLSVSHCSTGAPRQWMNSLTHVEFKESASLTNDSSEIFSDITNQLPLLTHLNLDVSRSSTTAGTGISSRRLTHLQLNCGDDFRAILDVISCFDTPVLSTLTLCDCHGDQISVLFSSDSPQPSFPALKSLSCVKEEPETPPQCTDELEICRNYETIAAPPIRLFPRLSSWSLINQCFTARILSETMGRNSQPWPLLRTVTVWPMEADVDAVYDALREVVQWKRDSQEAVPKLRLSRSLFSREYWAENGVDVELVEGF
ncbi:hypothetical protein FB45DRAFT_918373 [Roridomyces roridus]|uniref:F-box domain-containing protein n=1 Tax=Roridomyces roridus TaxID=1738132 RepID=A0AAD7FMK8_9AGAR|nr:hypothetical protein FB45DRAFT_918373 [Roridomyces roridus]